MLLILATGVASGHLYEGPLQWLMGVKGLNVLNDQQLRELRRIRTTCPAVNLYDNVNTAMAE